MTDDCFKPLTSDRVKKPTVSLTGKEVRDPRKRKAGEDRSILYALKRVAAAKKKN